jgi:hypothetical protein
MGYVKYLGALAVAGSLVSCGGGGSPGLPPVTTAPGTGTGTNPPVATVPTATDLIVTVDKASLSNTGSDKAVLTATAVDGSRNTVGGAPVMVTVDSNAVFSKSTGDATGTDGTFAGSISIGSDKANRLIRYTVTSGTIVKTGAVSVSGISMTSASVPFVPQPGQATTFSVKVKDASGNGVAGTSVVVAGVPGATLPATQTDASGSAAFSFTAPSSDGVYPLSIQGAGVTSSYDLKVVSPGAGSIPLAVGPISGASAIANPVVVASNTAGSTTNQSEVRVLFLTTANSPLPNMRVRFSVVSTALPGESLSTGSTLVYSDASGTAKTSYIAGTTGSPTDGVVIKACYDTADFSASACPNSVTTKLTVTANPVNVTIGTDNKIQKTASGISYIKQFEIQVVNSAGQAVKDVPLSAVVDVRGYWKSAKWSVAPTASEIDYALADDSTPPKPKPGSEHKWCPNEDLNRNGVLDALPAPGEDVNHDGVLTPRQADVAIAFPSGSKTDANGLAQIQLQYPQNVAGWELVKITVTAGVSGSEGAATYSYVLTPEEGDVANGSFLTPPYGSSDKCGDAL